MPPIPAPAFKEWHAIVAAIATGRQTLILRKGGIAEERGGFRPRGEPFWLLPTLFHEQASKLTAEAAPFLPSPADQIPGVVQLTVWAELHHHAFLDDWTEVQRLAPFHLWTESTVRERFDWSRPAGVHLLVVRACRLDTPVDFELTAQQAGCKSWVDLPLDPSAYASRPVLDDTGFASQVSRIV